MTKKAIYFSIILGIFIGLAGLLNPYFLTAQNIIPFLLFFALSVLVATVAIFLVHKFIMKGAPYVPTTDENIKSIIRLGEFKPHDKIAELGSGDGRIIKQLAKTGAQIHGYEINPLLALASKLYLTSHKNVKVYTKNFWKADLSQYNVIVLFGIAYIMKDLENKLLHELQPGSIILSNRFEFPSLTPVRKENDIFLYKIN